MESLYFLNLQYIFCVIYSWFGGGCTYLDELRAEGVDVPFDGVTATTTSNTGSSSAEGMSFFERLIDLYTGPVASFLDPVIDVLTIVWNVFSAFSYTVSGILFFAILSALVGWLYIRLSELYKFSTIAPEEKKDDPRRGRWDELLEQAKSTDPKLWRSSILEADRMLGELLGNLGYPGINTADKMRSLPEDAFVTVPVAWEAHRIRNFVSQGSSDFILTQREAFRVLKLYEQVFEEFNFV